MTLDNRGQPDNPVSGTVVDDVITLPERYDFYLVRACSLSLSLSLSLSRARSLSLSSPVLQPEAGS
jgi:hypothetical protein